MYHEVVREHTQPPDRVDEILAQWKLARPDLDASPMGIVGRISRLGVLLVKQQTRVFTRYGLDFASFDVLATLRRNGPPHELTPSQLARCMLVTPGAVAQRMNRLEAAGLITRTHSTADRRIITVALTDRGKSLVDDVLPDHMSNEERMLSDLSEADRETLAGLLRRLLVSQSDLPSQPPTKAQN